MQTDFILRSVKILQQVPTDIHAEPRQTESWSVMLMLHAGCCLA